ncbi:MAG: HAMP domain-containing histidine kinase [Bacteroidia bacterium]|nr:HAMP domain-containing histidine kinase [Bacteroidia bacterium]
MKRLRGLSLLMIITILGITGFQLYWLKQNYDREKQNLDIKTNFSFRQTILHLQSSKLKLDRVNIKVDSTHTIELTASSKSGEKRNTPSTQQREQSISLINLIQEKMLDSLKLLDTSKRTPVVRVRSSLYNNLHIDSAKKTGDIESFISHSDKTDSLMIDPAMIQKINVEKSKNSSDRIITINLGKKDSGKYKNDTLKFHGQGDMFIDERFPVPHNVDPGKNDFPSSGNNMMFRFLYDVDSLSLKDSVTVKEISEAYAKRLKEDNINIGFQVTRLDSVNSESPNEVTIGFSKPSTFGLSLQNIFSYMLDKLKLPILFSLLLIGITIFSFVLLYWNMIKQQRLAALKNEFISNITHELKTPIATVGVAIEALRNFGASQNPEKTKEYLDISAAELQRLGLLVDKTLKISMLENRKIELKKESFDIRELVQEVVNIMKLQFEKCRAQVNVKTNGEHFIIEADRLHITSVLYNLLDNALKYSKEDPVIDLELSSLPNDIIEMKITDKGIGIPKEYQSKIFDKFFRVPSGNTHNVKGYGLGLSYVKEIIAAHMGYISVESEPGEGSTFIVELPFKEAPVIYFDDKRRIIKKTIRL